MVSAARGISDNVSAAEYLPEKKTLPAFREAVQGCRGCDLYRNATQAVFGEGASHAKGPTAVGVRLFTEFLLKRAGA